MMYGPWDISRDRRNFLSVWSIFFPFTTENPENQNFEKMKKKNTWRFYHFTHKWQWWCTAPEMSASDNTFHHFRPFTPNNNSKKQNFEKMTKTPPATIILHTRTKNHDHMLHCSWDMARDGCYFYFSFWATFFPFTPLMTRKIKILQKWKNTWIYHLFTHVYQKLWSHDVCFPRYGAQKIEGWADRKSDPSGAPPKACLLQAFQERHAIGCTGAHICAKVLRSVINHMCKSNIWLHLFTT